MNVYYCYGDNTVDTMIYPRLKLKSEVFANVLDGKQTEFTIDNEETQQAAMSEEDKKRMMTKEARLIEKALTFEDVKKFQQTNIQDFFFSNSAAQSTAPNTVVPEEQPTQTELPEVPEEEERDWDRPPTPPLAQASNVSDDEKQDIE